MSDIYEQKPWLNDDPQTVDTLKKNLGIDGGSGLPEIEAGDDGKVLTVSDGEATWETPSAGGGGFYVATLTIDDVQQSFNLNVTYNDVVNRASQGILTMFIFDDGGEHSVYLSSYYLIDHSAYTVVFTLLPNPEVSMSFIGTTATENLSMSW